MVVPRFKQPILNRDKSTAVSIQEISEGLDEGNILSRERIPLNLTETADSLLDIASEIGARHVIGLLEEWDLTGVVRPYSMWSYERL